jgi:hypothetical protein
VVIFRRKHTDEELTHRMLLSESEVRQLWAEDKDYALLLFALASRRDDEELGKYRPKNKVRIHSVCAEAGITLDSLQALKKDR